MSQEGFLFEELSDFKKSLMLEVKENFPKETEKFIKKEASKVLKIARKIAKREVGTSKGQKKDWIDAKSYHNKFKVGKIYDYSGDICCRAYNSSPHAHLIEYGHVNVPRGKARATTRKGRTEQSAQSRGTGFTLGKLVFKNAELEFITDFKDDSEQFLYKFFDDTVRKTK